MKQRGAVSKASRFIAFRATEEDQRKLRAILEAGLAETISDALRCGINSAYVKAQRLLGRDK